MSFFFFFSNRDKLTNRASDSILDFAKRFQHFRLRELTLLKPRDYSSTQIGGTNKGFSHTIVKDKRVASRQNAWQGRGERCERLARKVHVQKDYCCRAGPVVFSGVLCTNMCKDRLLAKLGGFGWHLLLDLCHELAEH